MIKLMKKTFLKKKFHLYKFKSSTASYLSVEDELPKVKQFQEIPGPRGFFGISNLHQYLPGIGRYSWDALHKAGFDKYERWGPLVRERMLPGVNIVWAFDPDDIANILSDSPGHYPRRRSHLALEKYRQDRPQIYRTGGLLPTNGEEWWTLRSQLQKGLSAPKNVRNFLSLTDDVTRDFINNVQNTSNIVADFMPEISRLNLELICLIAFDYRMNSFSEMERLPDSRSSRLMESAEITNNCILPTDQGLQLWRLFKTPSYTKLNNAQEYMEKVAIDLITERIQLVKNGNTVGQSLTDEYLKNPNLKLEDIVGMLADLLLAGVHTSSYTTGFLLYYLATNEEAQNKLYLESRNLLPQANDKLSPAMLNSEASYARAVLKETFRLNPISIGVGRILNKDTILSGYMVPKDTVVVTQNQVACRLSKHFEKPNEFIPERWLKSQFNSKSSINPYLVLPFGHGMRSCIARRLAEQNILVLMIRLIRKFEISWCGSSTMDLETKLINQPNQPIMIKFKTRH